MAKFQLGAYLREERENQNLGVRELARRAKNNSEGRSVSASQISNIETGKSDPGFETLQKYAEALDLPLVFILDGSKGNIDAITIASTNEIAQGLPETFHREKLIQLLIYCMELNDEQIDAILGVAQAIRNFTRSARDGNATTSTDEQAQNKG